MARVRNCAICGRQFTPKNVNHKYCSENCRRAHLQIRNAEYYAQHRKDLEFRLKKAANSRSWYQRHKED